MRIIFILILIGLIVGVIYFAFFLRSAEKEQFLNLKKYKTSMTISSPAFKNGENIPPKYTCDGANANPALLIANVPPETQSLVLIMDDPDSPSGTWLHWSVWNIDPKTQEIDENSIPGGVIEGMTSFGETGYGGPCPHSGTHRYFFRLYALDTKIELPSEADKLMLEKVMMGHILANAELMGLYKRQ